MRDEKKPLLNRREFSSTALMAMLAGVTVTLVGCDSDSPTAPTQPPAGSGPSLNGSISANHGHTAAISNAQAAAGNTIMLDIRGTGDHPHLVELTGAELTQIVASQRVIKESTVDASGSSGPHSHTVIFN